MKNVGGVIIQKNMIRMIIPMIQKFVSVNVIMNSEQKLKKYHLELYSLGITKQYAIRHLNLVENDITKLQEIIEELENGKQ